MSAVKGLMQEKQRRAREREARIRFILDLAIISGAAIAIVLIFFVIAGTAGAASPPPRTAKAIPANIAHVRSRARYLARSCYPLDFWHVICPQTAPRYRR